MAEVRKRKAEVSRDDNEEETSVGNRTQPEEDELWEEEEDVAQFREEHPLAKYYKILRRTQVELGVAFIVHLLFLMCYIAVHVYDRTLLKRCPDPDRYFVGWNTIGGRFKYLTYITMWLILVYFFLAFFTDIMPLSPAKRWFHNITDFFYTTVTWPFAVFVPLSFWILFAIDREGVYPAYLDEYIPPLINHLWHTLPLPVCIVESVLVFHRYPTNLRVSFVLFTLSTAYIIGILYVHEQSGYWVYPFLSMFSPVTFLLFAAVCTLITGVFYWFGKLLSQVVWKERFDALKVLEESRYALEEYED